MYLNRVKVENFRGFRRIGVAFEPTTVLIGENNYGKTSLLDVLQICLGKSHAKGVPFPFRPVDFRLREEDSASLGEPIKVALTFRGAGGKTRSHWRRSKLRPVVTRGPRRTDQLVLKVIATRDPAENRITVEWFFVDRAGDPIGKANDDVFLAELRRLNPFLLIRTDRSLTEEGVVEQSAAEAVSRRGRGGARRKLERQVERAYHELATSRAPIPDEELERGVEAMERLLDRAAKRFQPQLEYSRRLLDQVVQTPVPLAAASRSADPVHGAGLHAIGKLLLFGAILEARGDAVIPADARPILGIEEPEAHLHPQTLASVWSVIEEFHAQKIVTTNSPELLAAVPLRSVRRLMRRRGSIEVFRPGNKLSVDDMRRIGYHIRVRRGAVMFARCWLLIEGETEFWLLPELARLLGYEFPAEGIRCVEFAQSGVEPLVKLANELGVEWHLLADGDTAGKRFAEAARPFLRRNKERDRITVLADPDVEQCLWRHGYAGVYRELAGMDASAPPSKRKRDRPAGVIERATHRRSKPGLALAVVEAAATPGSPGVPPVLRSVIETVVRLARTCVS